MGIRCGEVQLILTDSLGIKSYVKGFGKMGDTLSDDQKRTQLDISMYLLCRYEDDPGDFIERVEN